MQEKKQTNVRMFVLRGDEKICYNHFNKFERTKGENA